MGEMAGWILGVWLVHFLAGFDPPASRQEVFRDGKLFFLLKSVPLYHRERAPRPYVGGPLAKDFALREAQKISHFSPVFFAYGTDDFFYC